MNADNQTQDRNQQGFSSVFIRVYLRLIRSWVSGFVPWIAAALLVAAAPARAMLPIQQWRTTGGARVYFVENHDLPMLDVSV